MSLRSLLSVVTATLLWFPVGTETSVAAEVDLESLLEQTVKVHARGLRAWQGYSFRRDVRRERLDKKGEVEWSLELGFMNTPTESGFDEQLVEVDGRPPTADEIEEHRKAARWTKHYREVVAGKVDHVLVGDRVTLPAIWESSTHTYGGRETIDGVEVHRIDFEPTPESKGHLVERLADSIAGSFWVTVEGTQLVRWTTRITRPVKKGLVRMKVLDIEVKCRPVGDHYFASEVEMLSVVNLGFGDTRKRNGYRYSEFREAAPGG